MFHKIKKILRPQKSTWELYKPYISVNPSTIIAPTSTLTVFNKPSLPTAMITIGEKSHIYSHFSLLRPTSKIKVGSRCQLGTSNFICIDSIEIGDDVIAAWGITVIDSDNHSYYWSDRQFDVERCRQDYVSTKGADLARNHDWSKVNIKPVKIGNKVWIGFDVKILKGVEIGEGAIIGAGSVVTKNIKPWHIAAGNPCKEIRSIPQARPQ